MRRVPFLKTYANKEAIDMNKIYVKNPILFLSSIFLIGFGISGVLMILMNDVIMLLGIAGLIPVYIWIGSNDNIIFNTLQIKRR